MDSLNDNIKTNKFQADRSFNKQQFTSKNQSRILYSFDEARKYWKFIYAASIRYSIEASLILAIGARESDWGLSLKPKGEAGTGDFFGRKYPTRLRKGPLPLDNQGFGRGIMQIDWDWHEFARVGNWNKAKNNIEYAAWLLASHKRLILKIGKIDERLTQDALIASYNIGVTKTLKLINSNETDFDKFTAGHNYVSWIKEAIMYSKRLVRELMIKS